MQTNTFEIDHTGYAFERSPLDPSLLVLREDELSFFTTQTGIMDEQQLRSHILEIQAEAYDAFPYPCVRRFTFTKLRISRFAKYEHILQIGKRRKGALLLDVGCCFGNDIRTLIAHGFPMQSIVGLDLRRGFWDLGHKLFKSTPDSFPIQFVEGDIFDSNILDASSPCDAIEGTGPSPPLNLKNSLNPLKHHVSVIHASAFFHLFSEDKQFEAAKKLATLLSPESGSIILGVHIGQEHAGIKTNTLSGSREMFCHSPESWKNLWDGAVFKKGSVNVQARLLDVLDPSMPATGCHDQGPDNAERWRDTQWLNWSVTRL